MSQTVNNLRALTSVCLGCQHKQSVTPSIQQSNTKSRQAQDRTGLSFRLTSLLLGKRARLFVFFLWTLTVVGQRTLCHPQNKLRLIKIDNNSHPFQSRQRGSGQPRRMAVPKLRPRMFTPATYRTLMNRTTSSTCWWETTDDRTYTSLLPKGEVER